MPYRECSTFITCVRLLLKAFPKSGFTLKISSRVHDVLHARSHGEDPLLILQS